MNVSFGVVGHHSRQDAAEKLADSLNALVAMDDGTVGSNSNHDAAWAGAHRPDADWVVVLEDDAQPIDNFTHHATEALAHVPGTGAVSFYTGTGRPKPIEVDKAVRQALDTGASWLEDNTTYWGPAIALPAFLVHPMLRWVRKSTLPYDERIGMWLKCFRIPCYYTVPSLVDHAQMPSVLGHDYGRERRAHTIGTPVAWNTTVVRIP